MATFDSIVKKLKKFVKVIPKLVTPAAVQLATLWVSWATMAATIATATATRITAKRILMARQ